jgi:16S rRNA (uracil1498-N3)-methyltransferase
MERITPEDGYIVLSEAGQLHHLKNVLRVKPLERVVVFDGSGMEYVTVVKDVRRDTVKLEVKDKKPSLKPAGISLTLACAIPKKAKMDDIVDKLTQLGVECIIPLETERVVVSLNEEKKSGRLKRWNKIVLNALEQSRRGVFTRVLPVTTFKEVVSSSGKFDLKLIPTLDGERKGIRYVLEEAGREARSALVLIGPEGDFSPQEVLLAKKAGFIPVSLGPHVLRVDTAAIAVAGFIRLNNVR